MQLFLDSYGAFLGTRDGMFHLRLRNAADRLLPVRDVTIVMLAQGVSISANAMRLAIENSIPIILLDRLEHPIGQVWSGQFGSIATIRKHQALWSTDVQGINWVRSVLMRKIKSQLKVLTDAGKLTILDLSRETDLMQQMYQRFADWRYEGEKLDTISGTFRGWEGTASRYYLRAIAQLLPSAFYFQRRSKRPAFDPFNALLNYLYGFLYAQVELSLMKAGLDPYTGVLHADEYKRPTLVFDTIELYRCWAEAVALELCLSGKLTTVDFKLVSPSKGYYLQYSGKPAVVNAMLQYLDEKTIVAGRNRSRRLKIDLDAQQLAQFLKDFVPLHRII
jgi:CRISPR-associated protein Cas1